MRIACRPCGAEFELEEPPVLAAAEVATFTAAHADCRGLVLDWRLPIGLDDSPNASDTS